MSKKYPFHKQPHARDCGAVCLRMVAENYGRFYTTEQLRSLTNQRRAGVTLLDISNAAESIGMHTVGAQISYARLLEDIPLPGIAHYKGNHFVVVYEATKDGVTIGDPDLDRVMTVPVKDFLLNWVQVESWQTEGIMLLMEPTAEFYSSENQQAQTKTFDEVKANVLQNKSLLWFLGISMVIGLALTVTVPFFLQLAVDEGIEHQNIGLLKLILAIWLVFFICKTGMDFVKRFTQFHIGSHVHIKLVTKFMMKALQLPYGYFASKMAEDVMQAMFDNQKVLRFFTREGVSMIFGSALLLLFSLVLWVFDWRIFVVFLGFSVLQALVIWLYIKKRYRLNYERHEFIGGYYSQLSDLIRGVKDLKLNNAEKARRWAWERQEAQRHRIDKAYARSSEFYLQIPYYLAELRDIIIIFIACLAVSRLEMTAGVLVAIVFILLQLNNPLKMIIDFWLGLSEIKLSMERMNDVYNLSQEKTNEIKIDVVPARAYIRGENVSFRYEAGQAPWVLQHLDFKIPFGRSTAIIGPSGSGKTTLLNLILNILTPDEGLIKLSDLKLSDVNTSSWLAKCGVVPQDGHIFTDSIGKNIALGEEVIDNQRLLEVARMANILPFIERLPDGFNTIVGDGGKGLSKGQKQSILIARAIYKKPDYLFLDEATNDLDSENERKVLQNIIVGFRGKTIVLIASRMNLPVKFDNIIPLALSRSSSAPANLLKKKYGGNASEVPGTIDELIADV
ncbi:MAG: peptidase domain-containing ABC transporter [Bacteroidota bacterium]